MTPDDTPDTPIREEAVEWLDHQADRLMTDPEMLEALPLETVYEELQMTAADLQPAIEIIQRQTNQNRSRLTVIHFPTRLAGRLIAASLALLFLYGVLWWSGRATLPETFALAEVSNYEAELGAIRKPSRPTNLTLGFEALLAAPQNMLGLFPHYDQHQVERAIAHLMPAYETATDPFQRERIAFFLGKAYLMQGNTTAARTWLQKALDEDTTGYREETRTLLQTLEKL